MAKIHLPGLRLFWPVTYGQRRVKAFEESRMDMVIEALFGSLPVTLAGSAQALVIDELNRTRAARMRSNQACIGGIRFADVPASRERLSAAMEIKE